MRGLRLTTGCGLVATTLALVLVAGCGGGGSKAAKPLEEWLHTWRPEVRFGERPNAFHVPAPPVIELPRSAESLGQDVQTAASDFNEMTQIAYAESKQVFCTWFSWYVDTGHAVPSEEEFPAFLLKYGFGRVFTRPPSQKLRDAVELFRNSIKTAQNEDEATRNAAVAVACSV